MQNSLERLPKGHRFATFDGRAATFVDTSKCDHGHDLFNGERFLIKWGYGEYKGKEHPEFKGLPKLESFAHEGETYPNDLAEAEKAWETAEAWVRERR
ncbi:hypothetical protein LCGC14_1610230 [marine sediment metagenome]|uniref:Uncharacterized protein n=1 Tax=marine sediment metagenome TaxID=412755 RepID=A0A0F9IV85_9ZZZZ